MINKDNNAFDFEQFKQQAREQLQDGALLLGTGGVLTPLDQATPRREPGG